MAGSGLLSTCFNLFEVNLTFLESVRDRGGDLGQAGAFQLANLSISGVVRRVLPLPFEMMVSCTLQAAV